MSILRRLRLFYTCYLSKPASNRSIYRAIRRHNPRKIVELGMGTGQRALRMIWLAQQHHPAADIHYVGLDPFEGRTETTGSKLSLKSAHQLLRNTGVRIQLVPGNPPETLIRLANSLGKVDLLIVPAGADSQAVARMWYFVPRMLHDRTLVYVEQFDSDGQPRLKLQTRREIEQLAAASFSRRAA